MEVFLVMEMGDNLALFLDLWKIPPTRTKRPPPPSTPREEKFHQEDPC